MQPPSAADADRTFLAGDFGGAGQMAKEALAAARSDEERSAAERVLWRLRPDPLVPFILLGCLLGFVIVIAVTVR